MATLPRPEVRRDVHPPVRVPADREVVRVRRPAGGLDTLKVFAHEERIRAVAGRECLTDGAGIPE